MTANNAELIHSLCTAQADAFACADDLLPGIYQNNPERILAACLIAHALDLNPAAVMFGLHLKTAPANTPRAEKPAKVDKPQHTAEHPETPADTWPKFSQGAWTDSVGNIYDAATHGWNKVAKMPSVKANGTFRGARSATKKKAKAASKPAEKQAAPESEQAIVDANQVLASFKNHVAEATTDERLEQIGAQVELMGFTDAEMSIAKGWIAEREGALPADIQE